MFKEKSLNFECKLFEILELLTISGFSTLPGNQEKHKKNLEFYN